MKRCPECRRDYYDDTLLYCLDDGNALLEGPAALDEQSTAILPAPGGIAAGRPASESPTRAQINTADASIPRSGAEEKPTLSGSTEKRSFFARRAKPLIAALVGAAVLVGGYFGYKYLSSARQIESIAILPFVNDSGNADVEYLSDGLTETIIKNLSQLANLRVKPRSSVSRYKGREADIQAVGRELQVQGILNGRVVQRGTDLSLYVELVDLALDKVVWSEQYSRKQSDLVSLEHEVARDVTAQLKVNLSGAEEQRLLKTHTSSPEAYQLYLRGRHEWNKFTLDGLTKSISFFDRAIMSDPNYALAYSGLADSYVNLGVDFISPKEAMPKARIAALEAIAKDDSLAEAHSSLGSYKMFYEWDTHGAEQEYRKAIALDPNYANAYHFYSHCLQFSGREAEALVAMKKAVDLEPLSTLNNAELGWAYYLARQHDLSLEQSKKTLELEPGFAYAYFVLGLAYNAKANYPEARTSLEKGVLLAPDWLELQGLLAYTHASAGNHTQARDILTKVLKASEGGYINEVIIASVYAALDDQDRALIWLERGYQERCSWMKWIGIEPKLDKLRRNPRFQDLVRRVGT